MEKRTTVVEYYKDETGRPVLGPSTATIFYGQCGEDLEIYSHFFSDKVDFYKENQGYYIEIGASDGVKFSNTKFFEDEMGFVGILIEPVPAFMVRLKLLPLYFV